MGTVFVLQDATKFARKLAVKKIHRFQQAHRLGVVLAARDASKAESTDGVGTSNCPQDGKSRGQVRLR